MDSRQQSPPAAGRPVDPPPYAWLDDPAQPFGPVGVGVTLTVGAALAALGAWSVVLGAVAGPDARAARLVVGALLALTGGSIARMGMARRAWRRRHPGLDPLTVARQSGADVDSVFGDGSRTARAGRWLLVGVCAATDLIMVLALRRAVTGQTPTSVGGIVVIVALALFALVVGIVAATSRRR